MFKLDSERTLHLPNGSIGKPVKSEETLGALAADEYIMEDHIMSIHVPSLFDIVQYLSRMGPL